MPLKTHFAPGVVAGPYRHSIAARLRRLLLDINHYLI